MTRPKDPDEKQRDRTRTRARIVEGARAVFATSGFKGARMDEIAERSGVAKASVFHHFGSKNALFAEALEAEVLALRRYQQDLD
ncbi:TetR/AcrR family transcriptional regulator, partial [Rhodobaculum claviforme]